MVYKRSQWLAVGVAFASSALFGCGGVTSDDASEAFEDAASTGQAITCSGTAATCGTALASLDNVSAKSNGSYQGTGSSCGGQGSYGLQYQCVEFARRYWSVAKAHTFGSLSNGAQQLCDLTPDRWVKYSPSDYSHHPTKGDLIVLPGTSTNPYGHVAVVDYISGSTQAWTAYVVEQNGSCSGRAAYSMDRLRCYLHPI